MCDDYTENYNCVIKEKNIFGLSLDHIFKYQADEEIFKLANHIPHYAGMFWWAVISLLFVSCILFFCDLLKQSYTPCLQPKAKLSKKLSPLDIAAHTTIVFSNIILFSELLSAMYNCYTSNIVEKNQ